MRVFMALCDFINFLLSLSENMKKGIDILKKSVYTTKQIGNTEKEITK